MNLRIALCDDEPIYLDKLDKFLLQYSFEHGIDFDIDKFFNGASLLKAYTRPGSYNMVFMDIEMPGENGIDVVSALRNRIARNVISIFISNYPEYMYDSFSVHPYQFLQKPATYDTIARLLDDILQDLTINRGPLITVTDNTGTDFTINTDDIYFIEATNSKCRDITIHMTDFDINTRGTLIQMEKILPSGSFFRSTRNTLVNLGRILYIKDYTIIFDNQLTASVSRRNKDALIDQYVDIVLAPQRI